VAKAKPGASDPARFEGAPLDRPAPNEVLQAEVLGALIAALGTDVVDIGDGIPERHGTDWSGLPPIRPKALLRPRNTDEVSTALRICHAHGQTVTPQGGLTGLVGGARPSPGSVALSLERMRGIEEIDASTATATVLAGTPLEAVQRAADEAGFYFALDINARGSCTIGGNIATNAGGNRVLRYGMMRELVAGLEAVLPDGTVVSSLHKMIKNNTGADLKQLFIGTEGIFGIVTRAVLRLHPRPGSVSNAICRCPDFASVLSLLRASQAVLAGTLSSFEAMWPSYYDFVTEKLPHLRRPLAQGPGLYVLLEATGADPIGDAARFESLLAGMLDTGTVADAVIAKSMKEGRELWALREAGAEYGRILGPITSFDISFAIGQLGEVVAACQSRLRARWPEIIVLCYGHVGDGNVHVICNLPNAAPQPVEEISKIVYAIVRERGGSISGEHGIGTRKLSYLAHSRSPEERALMQTLKRAIDPRNILNPGKVLADEFWRG
jgi:FAD/FMN-containing dehydrogenase